MIIKPKARGFICITAHPEGCEKNIQQQIEYVTQQGAIAGAKKVLVIGASTGYGLASRIVAGFACQAQTIGVFFEKPATAKRTASAGWYNSVAFEQACHKEGLYAKSINGDAFSDEIKQQCIDMIRKDWGGEVDLVIYSLASPRRIDPKTGATYQSMLKPIGTAYDNKTVDFISGEVSTIHLEPAEEKEIDDTIAVMGGADWQLWIDALLEAKVLAPKATTVAYSYIGPALTYPIYRSGTIGFAKLDLEQTAQRLNQQLETACQGRAFVSVNKCLVTQASSAIPVVPLYTSLLYKVMKANNTHEGCIEQVYRLFAERLYTGQAIPTDQAGRIRLDELELDEKVQAEITELWQQVDSGNLTELADIQGFRDDFYRLFGFGHTTIDYDNDTDPQRALPSLA